ncbi:MAG: ATP-binding protein [Candidatus Krumholzibacteria bacterium]
MGELTPPRPFLNLRVIRLFVGLRMIVLALVVGAGIMIVQLSHSEFSVGPLYLILVISYAVGGFYYAGMRLRLDPATGIWLIMVADIILETAILHYSGGVASQFSLIFCWPIIAAAFLLEVVGGLGIAILASLMYVGYSILEATGIFAPAAFGPGGAARSPDFLQMYMHVSLFLLVGAVSGYLAERISYKGRQLDRAETKLRQLKVDTDNILSNMSSGVMVIDFAGRILSINPTAEEILGVSKEDMETMDTAAAFETLMPEFGNVLLKALHAEESKTRHELTVKRAGGKDVPLGLSISLLKDDDGKKRGVIAVFQDLTEVRDMQERVRKADRLAAIGELSAGIAHEIRNPLASISGSIEMLSNELDLGSEDRRLMELIMKESDRLDRIITDFLEFARLRPPAMEEVSVGRCLDDVLALLENSTSLSCNVKTLIHNEAKNVVVRFDEEQMKQVLLNLAINACEAMPNNGTLTIRVRKLDDGSLSVAFQDEGTGISGEARDRLFEPFFTTKEGGTGLGLAIAHKIVTAHGGRIMAKNRKGGGTEMCIVFPPASVLRTEEHYEASRSTS